MYFSISSAILQVARYGLFVYQNNELEAQALKITKKYFHIIATC